MSVAGVARELAPGLDWIDSQDLGTGGDGAEFAGAAVGLPGERVASVNVAQLGGVWYAELVLTRIEGCTGDTVRIQSQSQTALDAWGGLLKLTADVGGLADALGLYARAARLPAA